MQRTKYFNETRPSDLQLNWTDNSKASALSQRTLAISQMGIRAGFEVTVNGTENFKIDIATGEGYTGGNYIINSFEGSGSGERISTITDTPTGTITKTYAAQGVALADPTYGTRNYVSLIYAESEFYPLAERAYPFTEHDSVVVDSYTVSVLTETDWNLLSASSLNNRVLVAIVTGEGDHVALTTADIEQFTQPLTHPTCSQPGVLLGVTIVSVSDATSLGIATLIWNKTASTLNWAAPGDTAGADPVLISDSGSFTLTSNNTNYTVVVNVVFSSLQPLDSALENLTISSLYGRTIPMFSAVDQIHRDMVGSGQVTVRNPHGLSLTDISGGGFDHADLFHLNGISVDADADQLVCRIGEPLSPPEDDRILVKNLGGFNNSFLVDGTTLDSLAGITAGSEGSTLFTVDIANGDYLIYVTNDGQLHKLSIASPTGPGDNPLWNSYIRIIDIENTVVGTCTVSWNVTSRSLSYQPADEEDDVGAPVYLPATNYTGYYKVYSANETNWVIVEVTGDLGTTSSRSFTCSKENTTYPNESMLKLCVVNWAPGDETLSVLRDVRSYVTADNRAQAEEEHDTRGKHTKVLGQALRVAVATGPGLAAWASTSNAVIASASATAISAVAQNNVIYANAVLNNGVVAIASVTAVNASASNAAVLARASVSAVVASATNSLAVYATAPTNAIYGAAGNCAIKGVAASAIGGAAFVFGIEGTAINSFAGSEQYALGMYAHIDNGTALLARVHASGYGVFADATAGTALYGLVPVGGSGKAVYAHNQGTGIALVASASARTAIYATAPSSAIVGSVDSLAGTQAVIGIASYQGVYGLASNVGVIGVATGSDPGWIYAIEGFVDKNLGATASRAVGVVGHVNTGTGVYGQANSDGVGVYGSAKDKWGVLARADGSFAIDASAPTYGIYGYAGNVAIKGYGASSVGAGTTIYGIEAVAANASAGFQQNAVALYAHLDSGTAVMAKASVLGTGVYTSAPTNALYVEASSNGVYIEVAGANGVNLLANDTALYAHANIASAIVGSADGIIGVRGNAGEYGVYGYANTTAIYGQAVASQGVYGKAGNYGLYGIATATGATGAFGIAGASGATGVVGHATHATYGVGVQGSARQYGVYGYGNGSYPHNIYGVFGIAQNSYDSESAIGVYGSALSNHATAIYAQNSAVGGTALVAFGGVIGISCSASSAGIPLLANGGEIAIVCSGTNYAIEMQNTMSYGVTATAGLTPRDVYIPIRWGTGLGTLGYLRIHS